MLAGFTGAVTNQPGHGDRGVPGLPASTRSRSRARPVPRRSPDKGDTSLFVGMFGGTPENPKYIVAVVVEQAGFGAQTAAPIARRIIEKMSGLPAPPVVVTEQGHD